MAVRSFAPRIDLHVPLSEIVETRAAPDGTQNTLLCYADGEGDVEDDGEGETEAPGADGAMTVQVS